MIHPADPGGRSALYRLTNASTTGSATYSKWGLSETYDRYGNRSAQSIASGCVAPMTCPTNSVTVDAATNRLIGSPYAYDANGNMTNDGANTLAYDAENHAVSTSGSLGSGTYAYDGNGLRVRKVSGSTTTVYIFSGSKVIVEYENGAAPSAPAREYLYSGRELLAKIESVSTNYYHQDHLSNRLVTDSTGNTVAQLGHFPFGESWYNASSNKLLFTTYQRDSETGNDFAIARFYVSRLGRFSSPDLNFGSLAAPQSLNRYTYTTDDPIDFNDPLGLTPKKRRRRGHPRIPPRHAINCGFAQSSFGSGPVGCLTSFDPFAALNALLTPIGWRENPDCPNGDCPRGTPRLLPVFPNVTTMALVSPDPGGSGGILSRLKKAASAVCSLVSDAGSVGVGGDMGIGITSSAQLNLTANGASGELTLSLFQGLSGGVIGPDAYISASITPNAPDNSFLDTHGQPSLSYSAGYGRIGYSGGGGTYGGTFGPSLLQFPTASASLMFSKPLINLPYLGYLAHPGRAVCRAVTGH